MTSSERRASLAPSSRLGRGSVCWVMGSERTVQSLRKIDPVAGDANSIGRDTH